MTKNFIKKTAVATFGLLLTMTSNSWSAGYSSSVYSTSGLSTSYAGSATGMHDASDMFFNAANISDLEKGQFIVSVSYLDLKIDGDNMNGGDVDDAGENAFIPSIYLTKPINNFATFGFSVTTPFGLSTKYDPQSAVASTAIDSSVVTHNFNPSISFKINESLNFAIGAQAQYYKATLSKNAGNELAKSHGSDWGYGYNFGLTYKPTKELKLGLGYRSKIKHKVEGTTNIDVLDARGEFDLTTITPESLDAGISYKINDKTTVAYDLIWTRWSRVNQLVGRTVGQNDDVTNMNWHDSFFHALGVDYKSSEKLTLRAGTAFEKEGISAKYIEPRVPAGDRYWASLGLSYKITDSVALDASYSHQFFEKVKIDTGTVSGNFKTKVDIYSVAIKKEF